MKNKIKKYNEIYSLDVLEYVSKKNDNLFIVNLLKIINKNRKATMETFYLDSQTYTNKFSKLSPANCIRQNNLKIFLNKYLSNVLFFLCTMSLRMQVIQK